MANWYVSSVAWTAVAQFAISHAYNIGDLVRQLATPTVGNERVFRCTTAGTSAGSEPAWNLSKGATTTSNTAVFTEVTGQETFQGTSWAAPFARIAASVAAGWSAAGDTIFVSADHAETQSTSITATSPGTLSSPQRILCVTRPSSAIPPTSTDLTTGATITTSASATGVTLNGCVYVYGISFICGASSGASTIQLPGLANSDYATFERCTFSTPSTGANVIQFGGGGNPGVNKMRWINCNFSAGGAGSYLNPKCGNFEWRGGAVQTTNITNLFGAAGWPAGINAGPIIDIWDVDLSVIAAGSQLVKQPTVAGNAGTVWVNFVNCKLAPNLGGVMSGTVLGPDCVNIDLIASDNSGQGAREEHYRYSGSIVADTANYLTQGATDGTTHKSWKIVSNANASIQQPLNAPDIYQWIATTGAHTLTMYMSNIAGTTFKDNDVGVEVDYMGTSGNPLGTIGSSFSNTLATGASLATDTSAWTGQGGLTKQKVTFSFTTTEPGFIRVRFCVRKASTTLWVDPLVTVQ